MCERVNMNSTDLDDTSEDNFRCLYCKEDYFLNNESKCVLTAECGDNYYGEVKTRTCNLCDNSCKGCTGPDNYFCHQCKEEYSFTSSGSCKLLKCNNDEYFDLNQNC